MCNIDSASTALNRGWVYGNYVDSNAAGMTVVDFYTRRYAHSSREVWRERIDGGLIKLDGREVRADAIIRAGQHLTYYRPPWREPEVPRDIEILYEDDDLIAAAKPAGLPVLPGGGYLENTLLHMMRHLYPQKPAPVHRLGRGTSGVVLFGRSPLGQRQLSADLRLGRMDKIYRALVAGISMPEQFVIETPIGRLFYPRLGYLYAAVPEGKYARSEARVLQRRFAAGQTLLEVDILTGRPHQIRIHLAAAGHPLVGDPLYKVGGVPEKVPQEGRPPLPGDCGYHLHALRVRFAHPRSGEQVEITSTPPAALRFSRDLSCD